MPKHFIVELYWESEKISTYVCNRIEDAVSMANEHLDTCMWDGDYAFEYVCGKLKDEEDFRKATAINPHAWCNPGESWTADIYQMPETGVSFALCIYADGDLEPPHFFRAKQDAVNAANKCLKKLLTTTDYLMECPDRAVNPARIVDEIPKAQCHWSYMDWEAFVVPVQ